MNTHNVNDNGQNNININDNGYKESHRPKDVRARNIAQSLVEKFSNPQGMMFYLKVGYNLPEVQIWKNYELAKEKGKNPVKYFSWLCTNQMSK